MAWLSHVHVPHIGAPYLVTQGHQLLVAVHGESYKPDLTIFEPYFVQDSHFVLR